VIETATYTVVATVVVEGGPFGVAIAIRVATFQSTLTDIENSLQLGLIDNQGIANSLSQKIQAAADAAAQGQNETKANILNALKNQINAQTGKHITGVAVQVLLQDVDSLLSR